MKILIVEDDKSTLTLIQHFLRDAGHEIVTCRNGEEGLKLVRETTPDLAMIDGLIPGIHGFELCKTIKEDPALPKKPKVILMSSVYRKMKYRSEVAEYKADAFLVKPFEKEDLIETIDSLFTKAPGR
ncbi:MAG: response regulator [Thermodesulfovibrionales bacterium]